MFLKQLLIIASLLWAFGECSTNSRSLEGESLRHVVHLLPFDIKVALDGNSDPNDVNIYTLKQIVTDWMDESFKVKSEGENMLNSATEFEYVLLEIVNRRELEEAPEPVFYKAVFRGFSVWNLADESTPPVNPDLVELIQRATFLEDKKLLEKIRNEEDAGYAGLGAAVLDVRAEVADESNFQATTAEDSESNDESLEIIITIAIVVACLAFCLLMFAVIWAWRTDKAKREAYKVGRNQPGVVPDKTGDESEPPTSPKEKSPPRKNEPPPPVRNQPPEEIPAVSNYPESVISDSVVSEDVETSFTAYYNERNQTAQPQPLPPNPPPREFNDGASMSSMDSYGYSLDGYASSLGPAQTKFPGGALSMPQNGKSALDTDESDVDLAPNA